LVILLHGCGQDGAHFAAETGWTVLADRLRFPLLLPQQEEANNAQRCFQWFHPSETARGQGEAGSIAAMTQSATSWFETDPRRVFIVGLSAGGAMAAALMAAYPELFTAGACIAGLPVGAARSGIQALLRMASAGLDQHPEDWAARVRRDAPAGFAGPWPRLSIWQGQADSTVAPENAQLLAEQWCALHGVRPDDMTARTSNGIRQQVWSNGPQRAVELWTLDDLPHAYPVGNRAAPPGRFISQAGIDATAAIARFFGLD
jgi:feruloyl esterase